MLRKIVAWWKRRQRKIDEAVLWPSIRAQSDNLDQARSAMKLHALHNEAWNDMTELEIELYVAKLS